MSEAVTPNRLEEVIARSRCLEHYIEPHCLNCVHAQLAALRAALETDPSLYEELGIAYDGRYLARSGARWQDEWSRDVDAWSARDDTEEKK